eukprot:Partr_v1_DN28296_c3_g1_i1_m75320 putative FYVE, RhoGEF and PH domain containing
MFLNETIRRHEIILEMLRLQKQISGLSEDLIAPGRILVKRGILTKICRKSTKQRALFLFSDILIYASVSTAPTTNTSEDGSFVFHRSFRLDEMRVISDSSSVGAGISDTVVTEGGNLTVATTADSSEDCVFQVKTPLKSFALICKSTAEKGRWVDALNTTVSAYKLNKSTLKLETLSIRNLGDENSYSAPVWIPDNAVNECMECLQEFTVMKRRHHCRSCGRVLCGNCSTKKTFLPSQHKLQSLPQIKTLSVFNLQSLARRELLQTS